MTHQGPDAVMDGNQYIFGYLPRSVICTFRTSGQYTFLSYTLP